MKHYLIAMAIRTACFPVAVWAFTAEHYVLATITGIGAIIIPSFAVMFANAVDHRTPTEAAPQSPVRALGDGRSHNTHDTHDAHDGHGTPAAGGPGATDAPLTGTIVASQHTAYPPGAGDPERPPPGAEAGRREAS